MHTSTRSTSRRLTILLSLVLTLAAAIAHAHAQAGTPRDPYVITSAPYTISKPGYYILGRNLSYAGTSGNIITVGANNVTLDFNGFYIAGPAGNTSQNVYGVYAVERSNVTIKNGTIAFCHEGIFLDGTGGANTNAVDALVDNMRVTYCYFVGIHLELCPGGRIQNCQVTQTGYSGASSAFALFAYGSGIIVQNNTVSTVTASNTVGIYAPSCFARQNTIFNAYYGVYSGKYQDNLTSGCTTACANGTDAGGNN